MMANASSFMTRSPGSFPLKRRQRGCPRFTKLYAELLPFVGAFPGAVQDRPADSDLSQAGTPPARRAPQRVVCQRKIVCPPACRAERGRFHCRAAWAATTGG